MSHPVKIPVARPLLPEAEAILPYLREIDRSRTYSNFGPLVAQLQSRLASSHGLESEQVVTAANCTLGLAAVLMVLSGRRGGRCFMPSWTFSASAHAVRLAGMEPHFLDVDALNWQLTPALMEQQAPDLDPSDAVMVVAPFGAAVDVAAWDDFTKRTGVAVVIDAASAFASQRPGRTPVVVSLHATKSLGIGEGAYIMSEDAELVGRVKRTINFGFSADRQVVDSGMNAKLPEVSAAVGLAALDAWPKTRARWAELREHYEAIFAGASNAVTFHRSGVASTLIAKLQHGVPELESGLAARGIGTRHWWSDGCHREAPFQDCPHSDLPVTEQAAQTSLGLPFYLDMGSAEVAEVSEAVFDLLMSAGAM